MNKILYFLQTIVSSVQNISSPVNKIAPNCSNQSYSIRFNSERNKRTFCHLTDIQFCNPVHREPVSTPTYELSRFTIWYCLKLRRKRLDPDRKLYAGRFSTSAIFTNNF